ncbi:hypothetical protein PSPO01_00020 [Paraphaeosphaeria sporulosa]
MEGMRVRGRATTCNTRLSSQLLDEHGVDMGIDMDVGVLMDELGGRMAIAWHSRCCSRKARSGSNNIRTFKGERERHDSEQGRSACGKRAQVGLECDSDGGLASHRVALAIDQYNAAL